MVKTGQLGFAIFTVCLLGIESGMVTIYIPINFTTFSV